MTTRNLALALCVTLFVSPTLAAAQTIEAPELETEARARYSLGELYYSQARFAEAAREFEAAYALHAHPLLLHNIYLARRDMGDFPAATDALTRYLAAATDLSAADRRLLEGRLAAMRRQVDAMPHEAPPVEVTPPPDPVVGDTTPVSESLGDPARSSPPPPAHDESLMTGAIISFTIAGAAIVMLSVAGGVALSQRSDLASTCAPSCTDEQVSGVRTLGAVADAGIAIASIAAATGVVLAILGLQSQGDVSVTPSVSTDHAALFVGGTF